MGYLKSAGTVFIYIGLFLALVTFLPGVPPEAQFSEYSIKLPQFHVDGDPRTKVALDNAEILLQGELKGPESFASYNGELYTTVHGGDVIKIVGKHIVPIVKFGKPCDGFWEEKKCGRPLGLQFDKNGVLYVVDAYYGIYKVDVVTGKYEQLVDVSEPIEGVAPKLANSVDIDSNGNLYWTDSSCEFLLQDGVYTLLANPSGRLIKYDVAKKRNTVLLSNLGFANGVKLSNDESFVVVSETSTARLTKFNLKGAKAGKAEPFSEGLPGLPDNIHTDGADGFLVSLVVVASPDHPIIGHTLIPHPNIRKMLARLLYVLETPFRLIDEVYPNYYSKKATHWLGHFESVNALLPVSAAVLRIDANGKIIDKAYSFDGKLSGISSAFIFKDHVYLGSPYNEYLARVSLKQAFPSIKPKVTNVPDEKIVNKQESRELPKSAEVPKQPTPPTTTSTPAPPTAQTTPKPVQVPTTPKPSPPPPKQQVTTPPPPKQQVTTPPPPKQQVTTPPSPKQQVTTPPPSQQKTTAAPPPKQQATTAPPPQQQQQKAVPKPTAPPPPSPANKVPAKEPSPAQQVNPQAPSKPAATQQAGNNAQTATQPPKNPPVNPNSQQKSPSKPDQVADGHTVKPLVATPTSTPTPPPPQRV